MKISRIAEHVAMGAAAGLAGTIVIQMMRTANMKLLPKTMPPIRRDPGEFMVHQAERALPPSAMQAIPETAEHMAAQALGLGYGMTFGAGYAALRGGGGPALRDGILLGIICWAAGYLGWLPAVGLMPPLWKHKWTQLLPPVVQHALFGIATVAGYDLLHHKMHHPNGRHRIASLLRF